MMAANVDLTSRTWRTFPVVDWKLERTGQNCKLVFVCSGSVPGRTVERGSESWAMGMLSHFIYPRRLTIFWQLEMRVAFQSNC